MHRTAAERCFAPRYRSLNPSCRVHFPRNELAQVPKDSAEMVVAVIRTIFTPRRCCAWRGRCSAPDAEIEAAHGAGTVGCPEWSYSHTGIRSGTRIQIQWC